MFSETQGRKRKEVPNYLQRMCIIQCKSSAEKLECPDKYYAFITDYTPMVPKVSNHNFYVLP